MSRFYLRKHRSKEAVLGRLFRIWVHWNPDDNRTCHYWSIESHVIHLQSNHMLGRLLWHYRTNDNDSQDIVRTKNSVETVPIWVWWTLLLTLNIHTWSPIVPCLQFLQTGFPFKSMVHFSEWPLHLQTGQRPWPKNFSLPKPGHWSQRSPIRPFEQFWQISFLPKDSEVQTFDFSWQSHRPNTSSRLYWLNFIFDTRLWSRVPWTRTVGPRQNDINQFLSE